MHGDRLVVEPDNPAAAFLPFAIEESDKLTDGHLISPKPLFGLFADFDVGTVEIDCCVRNQPALLGGMIKDHRLLAPEFEYLALVRTIRRRIEILDALTDTQPRANGVHPSGLIQDAINGGAQAVQLEGGGAVEGRGSVGEVHGLLGLVA